MKRNFFLFLTCLFTGCVSFVSAQQENRLSLSKTTATTSTTTNANRTLLPDEVLPVNNSAIKSSDYEVSWKKNKFKDNWYISLGGGVQVLYGEDDNKGAFKNRITFAPQFTVGKYFGPSWGFRLNVTGGSLHGYNDGDSGIYRKWNHGTKNYLGAGYVGTPGYPNTGQNTAMLTWDPQWNYLGFSLDATDPTKKINYNTAGNVYQWNGANQGLLYMQRVRYISVNIDFMFDLFNAINGYDSRRFFEITPFGGLGLYNALSYRGNDNFLAAGLHAGFMLKFRLTERLGLNAEFGGSLVPDEFDGQSGDHTSMNGIAQATASVSYKIGKTDWDVVEPMDYNLINSLNEEINNLRNRKPEVITETIVLPAPPVKEFKPEKEVPLTFLPDPVFFKINKSTIDSNQWEAIDKAAQYLNANPEAKVILTGYADKETGSSSYNMKISEKRAKAVADVLIQRYGINPLRVSVNWSGSQIQPFQLPNWNRTVIFVIQK